MSIEKYTFKLKKVRFDNKDHIIVVDPAEENIFEEQVDTISGEIEKKVNVIDWVKVTHNFNHDRIKDIVNKVGRSKRDKKIIIRAIYDAMSSTGATYRIPYSVDKLLNNLYKENDENHKGLFDAAYDEKTETLNLDVLVKNAIEDYTASHSATNEDIDEMFADETTPIESQSTEKEEDKSVEIITSTDQLIIKAVEIMKKEKVIKHLYDYAFIMQIMNETEELPTFGSPKSFLSYFKELEITGLPGEDSIKKKVNSTFGHHPSWTFTDEKGKDYQEAKRRIAVGSRFLSIYRKGK